MTIPTTWQPGDSQPDFSLVLGGPLYQLLRRTKLSDDTLSHLYRRVVTISMLCWLPLLALTALEGRLSGGVAIPFLKDLEAHIRLLVVVPLLVVAELVVHLRMRHLVAMFPERSLIADADMPRFNAAVASALRLRNSVTAEILLIALVYGVGILVVWRQYISLDAATWYLVPAPGGGQTRTLAGTWFMFISLPLFQFLLVRWYFRIFIWVRMLWQISRIKLHLVPTHPDRSGGLGFLSGTTYAFIPLLMAHGALLAGLISSHIFHLGESLTDFKMEIGTLVVFLILLVQGPLLVFAGQLAAAKREGRRDYGTLAQSYARAFDVKWLRGGAAPGEQLLGSADIQSLADLGGSVDIVQSMRIWLISRDAILQFAAAIIVPIAPLALTMMPLEQLLTKLLGILF